MYRFFAIVFVLALFGACKKNVTRNPTEDPEKIVVPATEPESPAEDETLVRESLPSVDLVMGRFNPVTDTHFVRIEARFTDKAAIYLQKEAYEQFLNMHKAAAADSVQLFILSATRPFDYQRNIWERKWAGLKAKGMTDEKAMVEEILRFSAMPGTSRHHWGTDIDLNYLNNHYFETGKGERIYRWLVENAPRYGFCQPYTARGSARPYGYEEEKWHWSYLPLASRYFRVAKDSLRNEMIDGFSGSAYAPELQVVEKYVLGIAPSCR
jgi:LAS superfamily LD-carboxypeptidase LdcB